MGIQTEGPSVGTQNTSTIFKCSFYAYSSIEKIVINHSNSGTTLLSSVVSVYAHQSYSEAVSNKASVISVRGVPDGVVYSVHGRYNYEFVPGSDLKSDLVPDDNTTTYYDLITTQLVSDFVVREAGVA